MRGTSLSMQFFKSSNGYYKIQRERLYEVIFTDQMLLSIILMTIDNVHFSFHIIIFIVN